MRVNLETPKTKTNMLPLAFERNKRGAGEMLERRPMDRTIENVNRRIAAAV